MSNSLRPHGLQPMRLLHPGIFQARVLEWGAIAFSEEHSSIRILVSQFSSVQSLSHVWLFATPWTATCQASLSITNTWSLLKLMSIKWVMPSNHLILCHPLLLLPSIPLSIRVFSSESTLHIRCPKYWSFRLSISPGWSPRTDLL